MTVRYGSQGQDPSVRPIVPLAAEDSEGHIKENVSYRAVPIGEAPGDTAIMGRIPSCARVRPNSVARFGAITGITSLDVGLYAEKSAWVPDTNNGAAACLASAKDIHLAGTFNYDAIPLASENMPAWQLAGLSDDPGGYMLIVTTVHAAGGTSTATAGLVLETSFRTV